MEDSLRAQAQLAALSDRLRKCRQLYEDGLITAAELGAQFNYSLNRLAVSLDAALMSAPDPRVDLIVLVEGALRIADLVKSLAEVNNRTVVDKVSAGAEYLRSWVRRRVAFAEESVRMLATVSAWESMEPHLASPRLREAAVATLTASWLTGALEQFQARAVRAAMGALGPRLVVDLAEEYLTHHVNSLPRWGQLLVAMDELAAWAAATDSLGVPDVFRTRSVATLIELAGHPELTEWATMRLPLHRLSQADCRELAQLLADRGEVMPIDWISEPDQWATQAVEVAYLRSLDRARATWPGARQSF